MDLPRRLFGPQDNIGKNLYVPCLKECKLYRRATGFFQPSVLRRWAPALKNIVNNSTKIEILMGVDEGNLKILDEINKAKDIKATKYVFQRELNKTLENIRDFNSGQKDSRRLYQILQYLLANDQLEIKFSVAIDEKTNSAFAHEKVGYFEFEDGRVVAFEGSANESDTALLKGGEQVIIHKSWRESDKEDIAELRNFIDGTWEENYPFRMVLKPDNEILQNIREMQSQTTKNDIEKIIDEYIRDITPAQPGEKKLRDYQEEAIDTWFKNQGSGIFAHATGTGKTFTALNLIQKLMADKSLNVIVGVPYQFLADQWVDILNDYFKDIKTHKFTTVIECFDNSAQWNNKLLDESIRFKTAARKNEKHLSIYVVVNKTFVSEGFQNLVKTYVGFENTLFIGDECHRYSSNLNSENLLPTKYRLGLSATPFINPNDKSANEKKMDEYFKGVIHTFNIHDAIKQKYLCNYNYIPRLCNLNQDEFNEWYSTIRNTAIETNLVSSDYLDEESPAFSELCNLVNACSEKFLSFKELIKNLDNELDNTIVFCGERKVESGEREVEYVGNLLSNAGVVTAKITAEIPKNQRKEYISGFEQHAIKTLNAIKVLDEGIDIPAIEKAILLASSANRRQFVQRRGRVLRLSENENKVADIYDFIILPPPNQGQIGKALITKELTRMEEMSESALNKDEIYALIKDIENKFYDD